MTIYATVDKILSCLSDILKKLQKAWVDLFFSFQSSQFFL